MEGIFPIGLQRKPIDNRAHGFAKGKRGDFARDVIEEALRNLVSPLVFGERKGVGRAPVFRAFTQTLTMRDSPFKVSLPR